MSDDPWNCGLCGQPVPECQCGDPLLLVIRIPGLTADIDDHDLAARSMVDMINDQRHENWVCGGGDLNARVRGVRLLASAWLNETEGLDEQQSEDVQAGLLPGGEADPSGVLADGKTEGADGGRPGSRAGTAAPPARREMGSGVEP